MKRDPAKNDAAVAVVVGRQDRLDCSITTHEDAQGLALLPPANGVEPDGRRMLFMVVEIAEDAVTIDGNHPLAGMNLNFAVTIREVRNATDEERSHGHPHELR